MNIDAYRGASDWLDDLASPSPTPGGGAAAAYMIAIGAALVEMYCNLTVGREKFRDVETLMMATRDQVTSLRAEAIKLQEADSAAYDTVSAAYTLPRATSEEKEQRSAAIQQALRHATEIPLRTAEVAVRILEHAAAIASQGNSNVVSDIGAGALATKAGMEAAGLNVQINLASIKDETYVAQQAAAYEELHVKGVVAAAIVQNAVRAALGH